MREKSDDVNRAEALVLLANQRQRSACDFRNS